MSELDRITETRFERRKRRTKEQIKLATAELLLADGYRSLTVGRITERADVGYGTFYLHYTDTDDAVWDVVLDIMQAENNQMTNQVLTLPSEAREYHGWCWGFNYLAEHRAEYLELFGSGGSAELRKRYEAYMTGVYEEGLRMQIYSARIDLPTEFMTQFMAGATTKLMLWWLETPNNYTPEQMAEMLYRMVYRAEVP
jgi:AcrR family transcriptional regulator